MERLHVISTRVGTMNARARGASPLRSSLTIGITGGARYPEPGFMERKHETEPETNPPALHSHDGRWPGGSRVGHSVPARGGAGPVSDGAEDRKSVV